MSLELGDPGDVDPLELVALHIAPISPVELAGASPNLSVKAPGRSADSGTSAKITGASDDGDDGDDAIEGGDDDAGDEEDEEDTVATGMRRSGADQYHAGVSRFMPGAIGVSSLSSSATRKTFSSSGPLRPCPALVQPTISSTPPGTRTYRPNRMRCR